MATDLERSASGSVAREQKDDEEHVEDAMIVITAITIIPVITTTITMIVVPVLQRQGVLLGLDTWSISF